MHNYGLTEYQIKKAKDKFIFNKDFLMNNGIHLDNKIVPFADFVANSYINADRYIAELQHRAWSVYDYAKDRCLSNIFITLTLPSHWHPKKMFKNKLITNKRFGGRKYMATINKVKFLNCHVKQKVPMLEPLLDFKNTIDKYNPRNASKELSKMLKKLFDDRSYKSISNDDRCYFRVTEPHKDGTPHVHMSLFVPADKVQSIVNSVNRLFPAPLSKVEVNVESPVKYLMKYVLKTLDDLREDSDKITNLSLWYLYHGISRFYTSRTFVSLEVYRKLNGMYSLRDLTKSYDSEDLNVYIDSATQKIARIDNQHGIIYTHKPFNWFEKLTEDTYFDSQFESLYKEKIEKSVEIVIHGESFFLYRSAEKRLLEQNKILSADGFETISISSILKKPLRKMPYQMKNHQLLAYWQNLDLESVNPHHFAHTHNVMIERGLMDGLKIPINHNVEHEMWGFDSEMEF